MLLEVKFVIFLVCAVLATPPISDIDEKGLKSDSNDKLTNSIDDSLDDRTKRSYESGGYQWGSPNQADPFNPAYSPSNNYNGFGRSGSDFPGGSNNPFQQSPFDRGQPNNNERNPLQEVMGKALESVIVASVRQLLDMTPLGGGGGGQGDFMRSARNARSVENVLKISDLKENKPGKVNFIEKIGSTDVKNAHSLEKRQALSGEEDDDSEEDPELIRQQILQQNIMKEIKRRKRMRQQAYQQSLKKYQEKINNQKSNSQNVSGESWEQDMNDEQKLEYLSNYQKHLMDLYREKQSKERADKNLEKIRSGSKQLNRYSTPKKATTMIGDYPIQSQDVFSKFDQRKNKAKPFLSQKYSAQSEVSSSKIRQEGPEPGQGFIRQNFEETPQNSMMMNMGPRNTGWSHQPWDQSSQYFQQQGVIKDNRIKKLGGKSTMQQNMNQVIKPEIPIQEGWRPQFQQTPQNQQFFNEFPTQNHMMSQQIPKLSNGIPGKQRFQRISTNEVCKDGFTPSGVPCAMDTNQNQMNDGSFVNSPSNQEVLLQPPTLIKRYVTYSNRFIPPPSAVVEPVTSQEMFSGEGNLERANPIGRRFSDDGGISSSQEQRNQANEGMMNGWTG